MSHSPTAPARASRAGPMQPLKFRVCAERTPIPFIDDFGVNCLRVPLDDHGHRYATVEAGDYRRLEAEGALRTWYVNADDGRLYVRCMIHNADAAPGLPKHKRRVHTSVARLITGAGPGTIVRYVNGDRLDLRHRNLAWRKGRAKSCALELARKG